jgi:endonuclease/exonuclease/phosphatase family metal-dependent hydrolase
MKSLWAFIAILCGSPVARTADPAPLRIAAFNLEWMTESASENRAAPWKSEGELEAHRRVVANILAKVAADIVCVEEVTSRAALRKLANEPALKPIGYRLLHVESEDTGTGQDVAFLVSPRVRVVSFGGAEIRRLADTLAGRPIDMRKGDPRRQRLTKHALVCIESPKICLLGLHLLAHPDDRYRTAKRETQARIAANLIRTEIVAKDYAPIVLGDFNDFDPSVGGPSEYKDVKRNVLAIVRDFDTTKPGPELFNAASRISPESERWSAWWDKNENSVRDSTDPVSLIDHVLIDKSLEKRVTKAEIRHDLHKGEASDHWPIVVDLK